MSDLALLRIAAGLGALALVLALVALRMNLKRFRELQRQREAQIRAEALPNLERTVAAAQATPVKLPDAPQPPSKSTLQLRKLELKTFEYAGHVHARLFGELASICGITARSVADSAGTVLTCTSCIHEIATAFGVSNDELVRGVDEMLRHKEEVKLAGILR